MPERRRSVDSILPQREVDDFPAPSQVVCRFGGDSMISRRSALAAAITAFAAPGLARASSNLFEAPFRVTRNMPWAAVVVNGKDPLAFLIDTGSTDFWVTRTAAVTLGLEQLGRGRVQALLGRSDVDVFQAAEVIVGGAMRERDVTMGAMRDDFHDLVSGIIPMAKVGVMGLDFDRQVMTMSRGMQKEMIAGYDRFETVAGDDGLEGSAALLKRRSRSDAVVGVIDQRPVIEASFDGRPVRLLVDSGAVGGLLLRPDYVKAQGLWDHYPKAVETGVSGLLRGGRARMARAEELRIGRFLFQKPVVMLQDPSDSLEDGSMPVDGLIGMDILRRFNFLNHASRQELYLKPSQAMHDVYRHDRAGVFIDRTDAGLGVTWLREGSPAARAGLAVGDRITGWRGKDGYYGLLWALTGPVGSKVEIQVERDGKPQLIPVVLEETV